MLLEVKDLRLSFERDRRRKPRAVALDGVSFTVGENEIVGLVGESGSGKTVTALSIMRLLPPEGRLEEGAILFDGKDILRLDENSMRLMRGRNISMIFQEPFTSLNPVITVGEQISEVFLTHGGFDKKEAARLAMELLAKVKIEPPERVFHDYPHRLSGGQRQRAMIAMALALRPKLLIADEPTTALDVTIQSEILKIILNLKEQLRMSVLYITHDLAVVNEIADRVLVMKDGRIVESGGKEDIIKSPTHPYTKRLLDAIPRIDTAKDAAKKEERVLLNVKSVSKSFPIERGIWRKSIGEIKAVKGADIVLRRNHTLGLVGESASGKTTLGKIILGLIKADSGEITAEDNSAIQIVFQDPYGSLDPHLSMRDVILEGPDIRGFDKDRKEEILKDVLSKVKLDYNDRFKFPHQFSGGQRQRIAIARALAVKPQIIVLDEPVSSLDVSIQAEILKLLKDLQRELGLTYLFISHDLRVIGSMADEVAVMEKGRIVEFGPVSSIYTNPRHPYTRRLLASLPRI